jgi:hypothetical protein
VIRIASLFAGALSLAAAFLFAQHSRSLTSKIKRMWEALSAGVAVAYVFVNVLPELEHHGPVISQSAFGTLLNADKRVYLWALAGFITFARLNAPRVSPPGGRPQPNRLRSYRIAMARFGPYMLLMGYLLVSREAESGISEFVYVFAMSLHVFMLDIEVAEQFGGLYEPKGRALLASCVLLGSALGLSAPCPAGITSRLFAFFLGGVMILSAHEEVSSEDGHMFWWFVGGASVYACALMLI